MAWAGNLGGNSGKSEMISHNLQKVLGITLFLLMFAGGAVATPFAYITDLYGNVSVIDTATNTVVATVRVGLNPFGIAVNPDGTRVYVANGDDKSLSVINTATNSVIDTVDLGTNPVAFGQFIAPATARVQTTQAPVQTSAPVQSQGFEIVFTIGGILIATFMMKRKN